ncbi:MAG: SDR family oxidoreductase [Gammaproteobacteria bacterium]|nr:SDR family oxidoreductase [Gammaproteobacteria bacterium]
MPTVLVTGANRGLGYEHVKQYAQKGWKVIACARNPKKATELENLKDKYDDNFIIEQLEVIDHPRIEELAEKYSNTSIDILINNAGTTGPLGVPGAMDYQKIDSMDYEIWRDILEVNLISPFKVATAFHDHIAQSEKKLLIMMSSDLGSIEQNTFGGFYSYRASKAALNIISKGMSVDWQDLTVIALAPGWCKTYLGGDEAEIDPDESVENQQAMFEKIISYNSGMFLDRFGKEVPW